MWNKHYILLAFCLVPHIPCALFLTAFNETVCSCLGLTFTANWVRQFCLSLHYKSMHWHCSERVPMHSHFLTLRCFFAIEGSALRFRTTANSYVSFIAANSKLICLSICRIGILGCFIVFSFWKIQSKVFTKSSKASRFFLSCFMGFTGAYSVGFSFHLKLFCRMFGNKNWVKRGVDACMTSHNRVCCKVWEFCNTTNMHKMHMIWWLQANPLFHSQWNNIKTLLDSFPVEKSSTV